MKVIKEAMNKVPEVNNIVGTEDIVMAQAKADAVETEKELKDMFDAEKLSKAEPITGHDKKDYPEEVKMPKIELDESLFEDIEDVERKKDALAEHNFEYALDSEESRQEAIDDCNQTLNVLNNITVEDIQDAKAADNKFEFDETDEESFNDDFEESLEGNAFEESCDFINYTAHSMMEQGLKEEIQEMRTRALSEDYKEVCTEYLNKCNEMAENFDDEYIVEGLEFVTQGLNINEAVNVADLEDKYLGKIIKINQMINPDSDIDDSKYNGATGEVEFIDDMGQLFGSWGGLAVIPGTDDFEIIG